ncbi:hypothetical protein [Longimicrobium sp.]|uniref:hypothetical protein n=1 Tax=Longimicrobium sp. TaxID=2029185 RepID=UPI002C8BFED2|nr:hypothetical protein [Longimicrobium sp.]HSU14584.1 hypothetical protein [Longimicrobium sp.]
METRFRTPTGEVQWMHAAPYAVQRADFAEPGAGLRDLVGAVFTSAKELRHLAEQLFSEEFVPTRALAESAHFGVFAVDTPGGRVMVHAERERHWHPFRITRVEASPADDALLRGEALAE